MKDKKRHSGVVNNKFPFKKFVRYFTVIQLLLVLHYGRYDSTLVVYGMRAWVLIFTVIVLGGIGLVLSWRFERNWISLISGTLLPVLFYEVISMWKYSHIVRMLVFFGVIIAIVVGAGWAFVKVSGIKCVPLRRRVFVVQAARTSRIICCFVLFWGCIYGKYLINTRRIVSNIGLIEVNLDSQDEASDEDALETHIATVSKMDPDGGWGSLTVEEKMTVLETVIRIECQTLGMTDSAPSLELVYLSDGLLGAYNSQDDIITLSYNYVIDSGANGYSVVQVLCHELHHRYQWYQIRLIQALEENDDMTQYVDLLLLDDAKIYEEETHNYIPPGGSYSLYRSQRVEQDAEKYGNECVANYYEQIRAYLDSEQ